MKYFTIVKYHPCVQLAHAYEHLFVSTVTEYLYQHNRYKLLDYSLNGETYESGVIVINGECYNNESEKLLNNIATMKADLESEKSGYLPVAQAISQIGAEDKYVENLINTSGVIISFMVFLDNKATSSKFISDWECLLTEKVAV